MAEGVVLCQGDKTTCGGMIIVGSAHGENFGKPQACEGDLVTCGKDGKIYRIIGGISFYTIGPDNKRIAGSLDSYSSCPCKARILPSNAYPIYVNEESSAYRNVGKASVTSTLASPMPGVQPEQYAQLAKKQNNVANVCRPADNPLLNGVFLWTETTGAGHVFVSVHQDNSIYLYTYGRYGRTDPGNLTGDGILNFFQDEDARNYYRYELYEMDGRVFYIADADPTKIRSYFEDMWSSGTPSIQSPNMLDGTKRRGRSIDKYDVTGSNCTTHSVKGIKFAGSKVFDTGYQSATTQLYI